ncbi:MFS transporter [Bailinhaonella thermotolerans]|uniref:MFS transporter n=1 Tax=Bailinhaonella thermotolerans TaxID=1070861 RepID=A0A3A4ASM9_9ACTN|nr:MFS transporter [Bailinhaonella thermotolerans]RJL31589.1 MFS transporter [Bailinhaonella thermotolerans]
MAQMTPAGAGPREWLGLAVLTIPVILLSNSITILFLAVPWITAGLRPTGTELLWIMDIYTFVLAGLLMTMGALGDRIGRRRVLLGGAVVFGVGSAAAAYSTSPELLIAARVLLGVGAATLMPSTLALIRTLFRDPGQRKMAVGIWTAGSSGGVVLGPPLGGFLLEYFWWGSVFLINVPFMVLLLIAGVMLLPESMDPRKGRFDLLGAVLSLAAVLPLIYGLKQLALEEPSLWAVGALAAGVAFGVAFVRRQRRLADPMIDIDLFRRPVFATAVSGYALVMFALTGGTYLASPYLQQVLGLSPLPAALWQMPAGAGVIVAAVVAGYLAQRVRPGPIFAAGPLLMGAGLLLMAQVQVDSGLAVLVPGTILVGAGTGIVATVAVDIVLGSVPPERSARASALSETSLELGTALGIALMGLISTAVYSRTLLDTVPEGLPEAETAAASETLSAALAIAGELSGQLGAQLAAAARSAFTLGMQVPLYVTAALMVALAAVALFALRGATIKHAETEVH